MNWEAVAAIGEIIGAGAVVASLVYLAAQIRHANRSSQAQTSQSMIEMVRQEILSVAEPPEIWTAFTRDEISFEQKLKLHQWLVAAMRQREYEWISQNRGGTDPEMFEAYAGIIPVLLGTERTRRWWAYYGPILFDPGFQSFVDGILADAPLTDFWDSMEKW